MKINGSLVFDASSASTIQNLRLEKVTSLPSASASDVGRLIYNTTTGSIHVGYLQGGTTPAWTSVATGGDAAALATEVDAIETALGLNSNGTFNAAAFAGNLANKSSYVDLITALQSLIQTNADAISSEATTRGSADTTLQGNIDTLSGTVSTGLGSAASDLAAEVTRAQGAEADIIAAAGTEHTARLAAESDLQDQIDAEVTRATGAEGTLTTNLANEVTRATTAEGTLNTAITTEASTRASADTALDGRITTEVSDRTAAVNTVATNLASEVTRATGAETALSTAISDEAAAREAEDVAIRAEIQSKIAGLTWEAPVNEFAADHTTVDLTGKTDGYRILDTTDFKIYTYSVANDSLDAGEALVEGAAFFYLADDAGYMFNGTAVVQFNGAAGVTAGAGLVKSGNTLNVVSSSGTITVTADSVDVSSGVLSDISGNAAAITAEADRATTAEAGLQSAIDDEVAARIAAISTEVSDRNAAIAVETGRAEAAESDLQDAIDAEVTRATAAEGTLTTNLSNEVTRATAAEGALNTAITNEVTNRNTAIAAAVATEASARESADTAEATARSDADDAINARIDGMYFLYTSSASATSHTVTHNLGQKYCNVTVVDSTDNVVIPESVVFNSTTGLTVTFNTAIDCKVIVMGLA